MKRSDFVARLVVEWLGKHSEAMGSVQMATVTNSARQAAAVFEEQGGVFEAEEPTLGRSPALMELLAAVDESVRRLEELAVGVGPLERPSTWTARLIKARGAFG